MTESYHKIKRYIDAIPQFGLAFVFASYKGMYFHGTYHTMQDDCLQTIALACLESSDERSLNNRLSHHLYYLYTRTRSFYAPIPRRIRKPNWRTKPATMQHCDECGQDKQQYMRKGFIEGKQICGACYMRYKREDRRRNR